MVWIHGGAFEAGGTVDPMFDCHNFVKENPDVIGEGRFMLFVLEKEEGRNYNEVEFSILTDVLHAYRVDHEYITAKKSDFYSDDELWEGFRPTLKSADELDPRFEKAIPIGEIDYIEKFLKIYHDIDHENSIEIPPCLREDRFLKRKYSIVPIWEIPRSGVFFIKDATQQKVFSYKGDLKLFLQEEMFEPRTSEYDTSLRLDPNHLYQVSEIVNVMAEYRVYVLGGKVETISHFAGNPFKLPDLDLIKEAIEIYNKQQDCPGSYSLDVMITPKGTAITEVHNFMCLGLYNVNWDERLLYAYRDGWNYVIEHNSEQTEFSNF